MLDQEGAERRADDRGDAEHARQQALNLGALGRRVDVADDGVGERLHRAGAHALQRAEGDQPEHVVREAAQRRAQQEDAGAGKEDASGGRRGRPGGRRSARSPPGQQVGGEYPAEEMEVAQSATMVGIAVPTMVFSTAAMKVAIMHAARIRLRRPAAAFGTSCLALVSDMQRAPAVLTAGLSHCGASSRPEREARSGETFSPR